MSVFKGCALSFLALVSNMETVSSFSMNQAFQLSSTVTQDFGLRPTVSLESHKAGQSEFDVVSRMTASAAILGMFLLTSTPVLADEFGVETEAPTLFTGETVEVR